MFLYPEIILDITQVCEKYRRKIVDEEQLQEHLWNAVQTIVAVEEKDLRTFLRQAESRVELLRFTVDRDKLYEETLILVIEIEERCKGRRSR